MLTRDEVVTLLKHLGQAMTVATWSSMVSRHQAPAPDETIVRTPRWREETIRDWADSRPGQGARTDRHASVITADHRARCACGQASPDYTDRYDLAPEILDRIAAEWARCHGRPLRQLWPHTIYVIGPHAETDAGMRRTVHGPYEAARILAESPARAARAYWGDGVWVGTGHASTAGTLVTSAVDHLVHDATGRHIGYVETQ